MQEERKLDVDRELKEAVSTGKVILGSDKTVQKLKAGEAKLVVLASNCPDETRADVKHYAKINGTPIYSYRGDSAKLGLTCGKPFLVSAIAIIDPGRSNILGLEESR